MKVFSVAFSLLIWLKVVMSIFSHAFISGFIILLETVSIVFKQVVSFFSHLSSHTFRDSENVRLWDVSSSFLKRRVSPGRQNARVLPAHTGAWCRAPQFLIHSGTVVQDATTPFIPFVPIFLVNSHGEKQPLHCKQSNTNSVAILYTGCSYLGAQMVEISRGSPDVGCYGWHAERTE